MLPPVSSCVSGCPVASPSLWGKLQNLSFGHVANCENCRKSRTKCWFFCIHVSCLESLVFLWRRRVYGGSWKTYPFRMFPSRLSCRFAWQAWHFVTFQTCLIMYWNVKIGGSLVRNACFSASTCLVSSRWFSCGVAVPMGEAGKPVLFECVKQVVMSFCVAGVALCDIPSCLITCGKYQNWRKSRTKCLFFCIHASHLESLVFPVASSCLWGKPQNLSFSKVSKQVVMSFCVAGVALCDIPSCLITCGKYQNGRKSRTKCLFFCIHASRLESLVFPVASSCLWGKPQNLSFSKVSKQVVMSFCVAGVALSSLHARHFTLLTLHSTLHTLHTTLYTFHSRLHTLHFTLHTPHFTLLTPHSTLYTPHQTLYTPHSTLYTAHFTLHTFHSTLHTPHFTLHTLHSSLHALHSTLYTPHSTLYTPHFTLHTLHFTLHTPHSTLYTLHYTLHTLHFTLYTPHSTLYTLHFTFHTPHSTLYTPHFTLHTPHFALYTPHSTLYTLHSTLYTPHSTLYTPYSTLYTLHSTLHTLHFTLLTPHSTLYTPHFTLYTPHFPLYTPHSTLYTSHSTLHTLHSPLHTLHSTLLTSHSTLHTLHSTLLTSHSTLHTLHFPLHTADW